MTEVELDGEVIARCEFGDDANLVASNYLKDELYRGRIKMFFCGFLERSETEITK
jgi:hypothetical protein